MTISTWFSRRSSGASSAMPAEAAEPVIPSVGDPVGRATRVDPARDVGKIEEAFNLDDIATLQAVVAALAETPAVPGPDDRQGPGLHQALSRSLLENGEPEGRKRDITDDALVDGRTQTRGNDRSYGPDDPLPRDLAWKEPASDQQDPIAHQHRDLPIVPETFLGADNSAIKSGSVPRFGDFNRADPLKETADVAGADMRKSHPGSPADMSGYLGAAAAVPLNPASVEGSVQEAAARLPLPSQEENAIADAVRAAAKAVAAEAIHGKVIAQGRQARVGAGTAAAVRLLGRTIAAAWSVLRTGGQTAPATRAFALATLGPVPLLMGSVLVGGVIPYLALAYLTIFTFAMDELSGLVPTKSTQTDGGDETAGDRLLVVLTVTHVVVLLTAVTALGSGAGLSVLGWLASFLSFGLWFGQVSNAAAHELIHRPQPRLRAMGALIFSSLLFGHHASAHRLVHHRHVATPDDPNSAEAGESFWQFLPRAWAGSFLAGWEIERQLMRARIGGRRSRVDPYLLYLAGGAFSVVLAATIGGIGGVLVLVALAAHSQMQLLLSDYVQHYGLARRKLPSGRYEPVGPNHSWDAPEGLSALAMLNAARHGDHHVRPGRPAAGLERSSGGRTPLLPHSVPIMCTIALYPPAWRRMMDRRVMDLRPRSDGLRL